MVKLFHSFSTQILFIFSVLIFLSQASIFVLYDLKTIENARNLSFQSLNATAGIFDKILDNRFDTLSNNVTLLASDFGLRSAITIGDSDTVRSMLMNHGRRVQADIIMAFSATGDLLGSHPEFSDQAINKAFESMSLVSPKKTYLSIVEIDQKTYQIVIAPVRAPDHIAYLVVGYELNESFIQDIAKFSGSTTAIIKKLRSQQEWEAVIVSGEARQGLQLDKTINTQIYRPIITNYNGVDYINFVIPLFQNNRDQYFFIVQKPWQEVIGPYLQHRPIMIILSVLSFFVCIFVGVLLFRQITNPIEDLVTAVRQVRDGHYDFSLDTTRKDEIGVLMRSFQEMLDGLAERDRIKYLMFYDTKTGLPNRRQFFERIEESITDCETQNQKLSTLIISIEKLEFLNKETKKPDIVLLDIINKITAQTHQYHGKIFRLGDFEFAVLFQTIEDDHTLINLANLCLDDLDQYFGAPKTLDDRNYYAGYAFVEADMSVAEFIQKTKDNKIGKI